MFLTQSYLPLQAQRLPEEDALDRVLQAFNAIQTAALATAVDGPPGGWKAFELSVQEAGRNAFPSPGCPAGERPPSPMPLWHHVLHGRFIFFVPIYAVTSALWHLRSSDMHLLPRRSAPKQRVWIERLLRLV